MIRGVEKVMFAILVLSVMLNRRMYTQIHTLTVAQGWGGGGIVDGAPLPPPQSF